MIDAVSFNPFLFKKYKVFIKLKLDKRYQG